MGEGGVCKPLFGTASRVSLPRMSLWSTQLAVFLFFLVLATFSLDAGNGSALQNRTNDAVFWKYSLLLQIVLKILSRIFLGGRLYGSCSYEQILCTFFWKFFFPYELMFACFLAQSVLCSWSYSHQAAVYKHLVGGVKFVEALPKSPSGKILRRLLREHWALPHSVRYYHHDHDICFHYLLVFLLFYVFVLLTACSIQTVSWWHWVCGLPSKVFVWKAAPAFTSEEVVIEFLLFRTSSLRHLWVNVDLQEWMATL